MYQKIRLYTKNLQESRLASEHILKVKDLRDQLANLLLIKI